MVLCCVLLPRSVFVVAAVVVVVVVVVVAVFEVVGSFCGFCGFCGLCGLFGLCLCVSVCARCVVEAAGRGEGLRWL